MATKKKPKEKISMFEAVFDVEKDDVIEKVAILSRREHEIAKLMAKGARNKAIAETLGISTKTLDVHRAMIKRKLGVRSSSRVSNYVLCHQYMTFHGMDVTPQKSLAG